MSVDVARLADLAAFARIEIESHDLEPWAEVLRALRVAGDVDEEGIYWLVKCYNAFDSLGSAWGAARRWPSPRAWAEATDHAEVVAFPCTQERRGLRGGRVARHLDSYVGHLAGQTQAQWVRLALSSGDPGFDFLCLSAYLRSVWGVGRQVAFEWAEFLAKALDVPVAAPDAQLWESEGPRRSIQRLYDNPSPDLAWLNDRANDCRDWLRAEGVDLAWEDFETIICDFNVMRDGRYYPGRHLAALREEIDSVPAEDRGPLLRAWEQVVPEPWRSIAAGIDKRLLGVYRDTGVLALPVTV